MTGPELEAEATACGFVRCGGMFVRVDSAAPVTDPATPGGSPYRAVTRGRNAPDRLWLYIAQSAATDDGDLTWEICNVDEPPFSHHAWVDLLRATPGDLRTHFSVRQRACWHLWPGGLADSFGDRLFARRLRVWGPPGSAVALAFTAEARMALLAIPRYPSFQLYTSHDQPGRGGPGFVRSNWALRRAPATLLSAAAHAVDVLARTAST